MLNNKFSKGIIFSCIAAIFWGLPQPLFFNELNHVETIEVVAHRGFWSFIFLFLLLILISNISELNEIFKSRKKISTNTLLIHGELDQVVPANFLLEAKDFFIRNNVEIKTHLIKNCDHHIPIEASSIALRYILKRLNNV